MKTALPEIEFTDEYPVDASLANGGARVSRKAAAK